MNMGLLLMPVITLITSQIIVLEIGEFRFGHKKLFLILAIELAVQSIICQIILYFFGYEQYSKWFLVIMDLPAMLTFFFASKRRDFRGLFTILVVLFLNFVLSVPSLLLSQLFHNGYLGYNLFRVIIFIFLFYYIHTCVRNRYLQIQEEIERGWEIFCMLPFIGSMSLFFKYQEFRKNGGNFFVVAPECLMIIIVLTAVFALINYVLNQLHSKYLMQEQQRILTMQNKAQQEQLEQLREEAEKTSRRWHDTRHYIQELIELLEAGDTETAIAKLKKRRGLNEVPKEMHCLHPAVNSILCLWAERSRKAGITVEITTDIPDNLDIESTELSALFANAFENAYYGCMRLTEDIYKFIRIEAHYSGKRLGVGFTNPCLNDIHFENDLPLSTKKGGGIGTRSMVYTVRRFHGTAYFGVEKGLFLTRFVINV